jgi:hypothetical protein
MEKPDDKKRDEILKRMLATPASPKTAPRKERAARGWGWEPPVKNGKSILS